MTLSGGALPPPSLQLWLADLELLQGALESAQADYNLLAADERAWIPTGRAEVQRHRRLARIVLRLLLARNDAPGARGQPLMIDQHGKPHLAGGVPAFNVSHSGGIALIAIAQRGPVGVDLETARLVQLGPVRQVLIIAAGEAMRDTSGRVDFAPRDLAPLDPAATPPLDTPRFLAAWTMLEAFAKTRGSGVGQLLTELEITARGVAHFSARDVARKSSAILAASKLVITALDLPAGLYGAACTAAAGFAGGARVRNLTPDGCRLDDVSAAGD